MHPELQEAIDFHKAIIVEGSKALVGYDTAKALANIVLLSEIPDSRCCNECIAYDPATMVQSRSHAALRTVSSRTGHLAVVKALRDQA